MTVVQFRRPPKKAPPKPARKPMPGWLRWTLIWAAIIAVLTVVYVLRGGFSTPAAALPRAEAVSLAAPVRRDDIRVTDGDTFRVSDERIRIANIDTPEMPGRARCQVEADRAVAAKARLTQLLAAGPVVLEREGVDRYGRTLAIVRVNGVDIGEQLIREGEAQRWMGRKATWC